MKIKITTHGGFAAGMRREPQVFDTTNMSKDHAAEFHRLVAAAKSISPPEAEKLSLARDAMSYTVKVEEDGQSVTMDQSDTAMTPEFAKLLEWCGKHAK